MGAECSARFALTNLARICPDRTQARQKPRIDQNFGRELTPEPALLQQMGLTKA